MFAPWSWDNIKLLIWPYMILILIIQREFFFCLPPARKNVIFFFLFFTGCVSVLSSLVSKEFKPIGIYNQLEVWSTEKAIEHTNADDVFGAASTFNHPLGLLGRKVALGYTGHLASHGIDYEKRKAILEKIYTGDIYYEVLMEQTGISHLFYGPLERRKFPMARFSQRKNLTNISTVDGYELYIIKKQNGLNK